MTHPRLLVLALSAAYLVSAADRQIMAILLEPIKKDLDLTDTQAGLLHGVAFMMIYAITGIFAGILTDRFNRTRLVAGAITIWSMATATCGVANSFGTLFAARSVVGIGEAVLSPAANSIIAQTVPRASQDRAFALYVSGSLIGGSLSYIIGGRLLSLFQQGDFALVAALGLRPWQATIMLFSIPGFLIALLFAFLPDPPRTHLSGSQSPPILPELGRHLRANFPTLLLVLLLTGSANFILAAGSVWSASFLVRVFPVDLAEAGLLLGVATLAGGLIGLLGGGVVIDRLSRRGEAAWLIICGSAALLGVLLALSLSSASSPHLAAMIFGGMNGCAAIPVSAGAAGLQRITPPSLRGTMAGLFFFVVALIGAAGPVVSGWLADRAEHAGGLPSVLPPILVTAFIVYALFAFGTIRAYLRTHRRMSQAATATA